jgi:hypothetical protein
LTVDVRLAAEKRGQQEVKAVATRGERIFLQEWAVNIFSQKRNGRRNKHGIPLRRLLIFGPSGLAEVRGWVKEWLKR